MKPKTAKRPAGKRRRGPVWEIATFFPYQGEWSEADYLQLEPIRRMELSDGFIEVLPMPTTSHQMLLGHLYSLLLAFSTSHELGTVLTSGTRVRLRPGKIREPDIVFMSKDHADRMIEEYWIGADLAVEIVSGGAEDRERDLVTKRGEYARYGIAEYWIVDPREERITVLRLEGEAYAVDGEYTKGTKALSRLLSGFEVDVTTAFAQRLPTAGKKPPKSRRPRTN